MALFSMAVERQVSLLKTEGRSKHREEHFTALLFFWPFHQSIWGLGGFQVRCIKGFPHKKPLLVTDWLLFKIYRGAESFSSV